MTSLSNDNDVNDDDIDDNDDVNVNDVCRQFWKASFKRFCCDSFERRNQSFVSKSFPGLAENFAPHRDQQKGVTKKVLT